jgi:hypothetical protein
MFLQLGSIADRTIHEADLESVTWLFMYSLGSVKFVQILVVLIDEKEETPYTVHEHLHFLVSS